MTNGLVQHINVEESTTIQWVKRSPPTERALSFREANRKSLKLLLFNPWYTGELFHCYMLKDFICHLGVSGLFCHFYSTFDGKSC